MTNFEKLKVDIQDMTAVEFACYIDGYFDCPRCAYNEKVECHTDHCIQGHAKWLESEVKE